MRRFIGHPICLQIVGAGIVMTMMSRAACGADDWLTEPERAFFETLGVDARVNGKPVKRSAEIARLPEIAGRAPQPLSGRIEAIARAMERMKSAPEERSKFQGVLSDGQQVVRREMGAALIGTLLGDDPMDSAINVTNGVMKNANVVEAWRLQRQRLERGLAARQEADSELALITGELERRIGRPRPETDLPLRIALEGKQLWIEGKAGSSGVGHPILQVTLYKKSTQGQWTGLNAVSGVLVRAIGVNAMDREAQAEGDRLAAAQERAMNLPMMTTLLLPSIDAGGRVQVSTGLSARSALGIERVEARLWSSEGWFVVDQLPGLSEAQRTAVKQVEDDRRKAQAARQAAGPMRPVFQPPRRAPQTVPQKSRRSSTPNANSTLSDEQKARSELSLGKAYLKLKKTQEARVHLEKVVKLAPDSEMATEARTLLETAVD
jgi:hypothetical protein